MANTQSQNPPPKPPPGSPLYTNRGPHVIASVIALHVISLLFVIARLVSRKVARAGLGVSIQIRFCASITDNGVLARRLHGLDRLGTIETFLEIDLLTSSKLLCWIQGICLLICSYLSILACSVLNDSQRQAKMGSVNTWKSFPNKNPRYGNSFSSSTSTIMATPSQLQQSSLPSSPSTEEYCRQRQ